VVTISLALERNFVAPAGHPHPSVMEGEPERSATDRCWSSSATIEGKEVDTWLVVHRHVGSEIELRESTLETFRETSRASC
jgi:hypothetical protein